MVLNRLLKKIGNYMKCKSVMKSWLIGYSALIVGLLMLVLWGESIFYKVMVDNTTTRKLNEINAFSNKMNMLTDDCRMYALKLTSDERFAENFLNPPHSAEAHFKLGKIASRLRREMNLVDEFFVYIKSEDVIINSLGNVSSPEHYYDVFYSNSDMNYEKWHDEFLNKKHSGFYVFDNNAEKKVEKMAKLCYVLPLDRLYKKDITLFTQIDSSRYENELAKLGADTETSVLIYDESGKSYFSMGSRIPADKQLKAGKEIKDFYETEINGEKVVMYVNSSAFAAWNYAFVTPYSVFWADLIRIRHIGAAMFILIAAVGIAGIYLITKYNYLTVATIAEKIETNFAAKEDKNENEFVLINKVLDIASDYGKKIENQQKKERINDIRNLFLGITDVKTEDNITFESNSFVTVSFYSPDYEKLFNSESMTEKEKYDSVRLIISNIFSELMEPYSRVEVVDTDNINFLLSMKEKYVENAEDIVVNNAEKMRKLILQHFEINVICGISRCVKGISNICISYREALSALNSISYNNGESVVVYTSKQILSKSYYYPIDQMQYLMFLLEKGDRENAARQIEIIFEINSAVFAFVDLTKAMMTDIAATIMKAALNVRYNVDSEKLMNSVQSLNRIAAEKFLKSYVNDICTFVNESHTVREMSLVEKVDAIIEERYTDTQFNVNKIAYELEMNANSLTVAYRRKTGKNISENIQQRRVNEAKRLLTESDEIIEAVAKKAGFASSATFRRVFKTVIGISASAYREIKKTNKKD